MTSTKSTVQSQVPDAGTPIFDQSGYINTVWHQFFYMLLRRTGGTVGVDAGADSVRLDEVEGRVEDAEQIEQAVVALYRKPAEVPLDVSRLPQRLPVEDLQMVPSHGLQSDPALHAVATSSAAGFMSAGDKAKLDTIASGSSVSGVTGTAPIVSSGGSAPAISITPATTVAAGSQSAADKARIDALSATSSPTFAGVILTNGQVQFPATQVPTANPNVLDDYAEGSWTPTLSFSTPGNLAVTYGTREGFYTKIGRQVTLIFLVSTTAFTYTTASGGLIITGAPFAAAVNAQIVGTLSFSGLTKSGYSQFVPRLVSGSSDIGFIASGSGVARSGVDSTSTATGTQVLLSGSITYFV